MARTSRVLLHYKYPHQSNLQLRIVVSKEDDIPDEDHEIELSEEFDAMGQPRWRAPTEEEASTNVNRLASLLVMALRGELKPEQPHDPMRDGYQVSVEAPKRT